MSGFDLIEYSLSTGRERVIKKTQFIIPLMSTLRSLSENFNG